MLKKIALYGAALVFSAALLTPLAASAALSNQQINSVMSLLRAFGADQSVIANVQASLTGVSVPAPSASCVNLSYSLYTGQTDAATNGDVTRLQNFLDVTPTGYFGPQTEQAVQRWQTTHSIVSSGSPDTTGYGLVGPQTSEAMGCVNNNQNQNQQSSNFTASPTSGVAPLSVLFKAPPNVATIDFGDGTIATENDNRDATYNNWSCNAAAQDTVCAISHLYTAPGTYMAKIESAKGVSIATQTITVTSSQANQPTATIDQNTMSQQTGSSIISGTATNITAPSEVTVAIVPTSVTATDYNTTTSPYTRIAVLTESSLVSAGKWFAHPMIYTPGAYRVLVYDFSSHALLAQSILIVSGVVLPTATIDDSSLVSSSASPTITGTATNLPYQRVRVVLSSTNGTPSESLLADVSSGHWAVSFNSSTLPGGGNLTSGSYQVSVYATNAFGGQTDQLTTRVLLVAFACPANAINQRGQNGQQFLCMCPAGASTKAIYGTTIFTDNSDICTAGAWVGEMSLTSGGLVDYTVQPGLSSYMAGTSPYGITSLSWGAWPGSFQITGPKG